jgi:hypothetical protein
MRLVALQSIISAEVAKLLGSSLPSQTCCFQQTNGLSLGTVPQNLSITGSSSRELYVLFRVYDRSIPALAANHQCTFLGVFLPTATSARESTLQRASQARLCSVLSVLHALDGLLLSIPRGLISSHCHQRDSPFKGYSPLPSRFVSSTPRALLSLATFSCP